MNNFADALFRYDLACEDERNWLPIDGPFKEIMARRDAAQRELHAIESPWQECVCPLCSGRD